MTRGAPGRRRPQQGQQAALGAGQRAPPGLGRGLGPALLEQRGARFVVSEERAEFQHLRVDIRLAADRHRVAQARGHLRDHLRRGAALALARARGARELERQHAAVPGAEVLGRHARAGDPAQVVVDVGGRHPADLAVLVGVLEQFLARQGLATAHDAGHAAVGQRDLVAHAALALERQPHLGVVHARVTRAQRRQAVRAIAARVRLVADADVGGVEQPHQRCEHERARGAAGVMVGQVARNRATQARQRRPEGTHRLELVVAALLLPLRVVSVLLAAAGVAARRLQVAVRHGADPHLLVGWRDRKLADAREGGLVAQALAVHVDVVHLVAVRDTPVARLGVADPRQAVRHEFGCAKGARRPREG